MKLVDTHTHLYLEQFDQDREKVITAALERGVQKMLLPNIDSSSIEGLKDLSEKYPEHCFPMMGLHPTSVKENYEEELQIIEKELRTGKYIAMGEIGIDLYWDRTFEDQQKDALRRQIELAKELELPIVVHQRDSFEAIFSVLDNMDTTNLRGVFHCFTGNTGQAEKITDMGFKLGIGGVLTFKNSKLDESLKSIDLKHLILETDSPFLAPVPYRGKRNESTYVYLVARKLAEIKAIDIEEVADVTTNNAYELFNKLK